jgi:hypothetical protein
MGCQYLIFTPMNKSLTELTVSFIESARRFTNEYKLSVRENQFNNRLSKRAMRVVTSSCGYQCRKRTHLAVLPQRSYIFDGLNSGGRSDWATKLCELQLTIAFKSVGGLGCCVTELDGLKTACVFAQSPWACVPSVL